MSNTSIDMPATSQTATSTGNSVLVVETSANSDEANLGTLIPQQPQQQPQQQQQQQTSSTQNPQLVQITQATTNSKHTGQQVQSIIIKEDFINSDNYFHSNNNLLNNAQIIKFVNDEQAALLESQQQQQSQTNQQVLKEPIEQPTQIYSGSQQISGVVLPNSKVHVIGNMAMVAKTPQHQTSNNQIIQTTGTQGYSIVNAKHLQSGNNLVAFPAGGKLVNIPMKQQSTTTLGTHQIVQTGGTKQPVQSHKMTVARNVQLVTRIQSLAPNQQQIQSNVGNQPTIINNQIVNRAPGSTTTTVQQHHPVQHQPQTFKVVHQQSATTTGAISKRVTPKKNIKKALGTSMKIIHGKTTNYGDVVNVNTTGTLNNNNNNNVQKTNTNRSNVMKQVHHTNVYSNQQILNSGTGYNQLKPSNNSQLSKALNYSMNNKLHTVQVHHSPSTIQIQQPHRNVNSIYVQQQPQLIQPGQKVTTKPGAKYMMHTTNNALPHQHTTIVMSGVNSSTGQQQNVKLSNVQQQHQLVTSNGSGNGGAIKYVNSMGNVISSTMHPSGPVTKVGRSQMSPQFNTTVVYNENGENIRTFNSDELYMANGNNMSEEMVSARILQSLSQPKTIHLNNNKQYHHNQNQVVQQKVKHIGPAAGGYVGGQSIPQPIYLSPSSATPSDFHSFGQHATVHSSGGEMKSIKLPDTFRVNPSDLHGTTTTFIDNIPLLSSKSDLVNQPNVAEQEDDIIGEEVIPAPIADGGDEKVNLLHAVLQDHSYVDMSHRVPRIGSCVESVKNSSTYSRYYGTSGSTTKSSTIAGLSKLSGFSSNVDDDAQSVISTGSRTAGDLNDIDLGEETETAPECEGEDDSVTRCICDLTHDDGYMICCDKCSTWQHVDCMGIDRQNIPDEYKCEICQPRPVDKERARSLQLLKRKEQQNLMLLNSQQQTPPHGSLNTHLVANSHGENKNMLHKMPGNITSSKKARLNQRRKGDGPLNSNKKKQRNDSTSSLSNRLSGKRRDCKKPSKRKTKLQSQLDSAEKHAANMRSWIENYEEANTNHYSPELRARLHAMSKQPQSTAKSTVKGITNLDAKCTTVPHAGGKILISTLDLNTQQPIVEIRGKYMLSGQCKSTVTSPTTTSVSTTSQKNGYGPFLFYYRLPNDGPEICVDTRTYGNNARFVRRSCRPNAELTYSIEKGTIHLYIVASSPIRCNTEITIPHDDQDIMAIKKGSYNVGNSPVCACGLTKDCVIASMTQPNQIQQPSTTTTQPTTPKLTKRLNGHNKADSSTQRKTKSMSSRGRSTSSSGESNMGLLSPNGAQTCIIHPPSVSSITSLMHDSGVYTSSSSPSISLPSPTRTTNLVATPKESPQTEIPLIPTKPIASKLVEKVEADSTAIILPPKVKEEINTNESSDKVNVHQKTHKTPVKTPRKMSEDATKEIKTEGDLNSSQSAQKKMTREERKLEAYLQAFAKMEKSQQRRKETKQHKSSSSKSSSPMKENKESPFSTTKRPLAGGIRKKKRKGSKSYQQLSNSQKRKRQKRLNSGDSDVFTSEESLLSPNSLNQRSTGHDRDSKSRNQNENDDDKAAGLLLAFSNQPGKSPQKLSRYDPNSYQLSSACLLVEAAVAPLENSENDFKVPPKTKTKKTIMNDWLHHSDSNFNSPTSESSNGFTGAYGCSEQSEILCFNAAQKVEEFINLQSQGTDTTDSKWQSGNYYGTVGEVQTVPSPLPTPPLPGSSCGSSVKKRWLRQAISEECSDEQNASSNGYSTPLKKRRVVMSECSDTAEAPSPTSINHNSFMSEAIAESSANDSELLAEEIKSEKESVVEVAVTEPVDSEKPDDTIKTNEESMDVEDDVDIMGSPPPEDKIVVEDNLVKIEPSDEDNDVRVDIEDATISEQIKEKVETVDQPINNLIGSVSEEKILSSCSEDKCTEENLISNVVIKTESSTSDSMEVATTVVKDEKPVSVDEFDIKPLAEAEKESVVPGTNTEIEEIADIQSLLQSFHSTNIKILETRNKKSTKSRLSSTSSRRDSVSPPPSNSIADSSSVSNNNLDQSTQSTTGITRRRKSRFEPQTKEEIVKTEQSLLAIEKNFSTATNEGGNGSMTVCPATDIPIHQRNPNSTIPVFNQNVLNACSASTLSMYQLQDVTQPGYMGPNQIVLPQFGQQLAYNMPQYPEEPVKTHIITQPQAPATRLLTDFFDKANNKITTTNNVFSSEIGYKSSMLEPNRTAFFPNHQTPASSLSSLSSTFLSNKPFNATTNNIEPTPVNSDRTTLTQTSSSLTAQSRVLSRSQSADPRLNPNLNTPTPPAAPKRKLSINEYRKRKQQSTDTVYSDRNEMKKDSPTPSVSNESSCDVKESLNSTDPLNPEETVVFSSAPTQLERQQEMLIERLKNMKGLKTSFNSINNLDNTINPDKTMSDDVTNLTSTKLNKLSESMNSLTSISSTSTISPATTPVHMSPNHSQDMFYLEDVNVPINSVIADTPKNESAGNEVAAVDEENK